MRVLTRSSFWICTLIVGFVLAAVWAAQPPVTGSKLYVTNGAESLTYDPTNGTLALSGTQAAINAKTVTATNIIGSVSNAVALNGHPDTYFQPAASIVDLYHGGTGLSYIGAYNMLLGVNVNGTMLEYKSLTAGVDIDIQRFAGSITINSTAVKMFGAFTGGVDTSSGVPSLCLRNNRSVSIHLTKFSVAATNLTNMSADTVITFYGDSGTPVAVTLTSTGNSTTDYSATATGDLYVASNSNLLIRTTTVGGHQSISVEAM